MTATVLYIDDNRHNRRVVKRILVSNGYELIEAKDALTGLKMAETEKPDLILMDINLPDMDGLEATNVLKNNPELKDIPVVALTANAMYGDRSRFIDGGCDDYLAKPVTRVELLQMMVQHLGQPSPNS